MHLKQTLQLSMFMATGLQTVNKICKCQSNPGKPDSHKLFYLFAVQEVHFRGESLLHGGCRGCRDGHDDGPVVVLRRTPDGDGAEARQRARARVPPRRYSLYGHQRGSTDCGHWRVRTDARRPRLESSRRREGCAVQPTAGIARRHGMFTLAVQPLRRHRRHEQRPSREHLQHRAIEESYDNERLDGPHHRRSLVKAP